MLAKCMDGSVDNKILKIEMQYSMRVN